MSELECGGYIDSYKMASLLLERLGYHRIAEYLKEYPDDKVLDKCVKIIIEKTKKEDKKNVYECLYISNLIPFIPSTETDDIGD